MANKLRIVVSGMIAADPWQGGATWAVLQYVLGFRELGHEVLFIEPVGPKSLRPAVTGLKASENAAYFTQVAKEFALSQDAALLLAGSKETFGLAYDEVKRRAQSADLLLNISGMLNDSDLMTAATRVYLDLDPAFNQLWSAVQGIDMRFAGHTHFVTIGQSIGNADCPVPTCGLEWLKTFQPLVLNYWPATTSPKNNCLTTVANWRGYGSIEHDGRHYGQKAHSLRPLIALPTLTSQSFTLALAIHPGESSDLALLKKNGWQLVDPGHVANTPQAYQQFIQESKGELGVAKSGYVVSRCGWFSDRSVCYLASGRPVIAQETGFSRYLPTGKGLFKFQTVEEALAAVDELNNGYAQQSRQARFLAEEYFDSRKVLGKLLESVGL